MRIYVSVDMEGIAGVALREQLQRGQSAYEEARYLLTQEVNAVVDALASFGVKDIVVKDAHGGGYNFIADSLHPAAVYVMGSTPLDKRFPGLERGFDGAFLMGYHAMASTFGAVRDHTMSSAQYRGVKLNGQPIGEIGLDSLLFGLNGVPVIMVSGDDKACQEAEELLPGVTIYATKTGLSRHAALMKAPQRVRSELRGAVQKALARVGQAAPFCIASPYEVVIQFNSSDWADARSYDGVDSERLDAVTARYRSDDLVKVLTRAI